MFFLLCFPLIIDNAETKALPTLGSTLFRIKPTFQSKSDISANHLNQEALVHMKRRQYTAKMTAWDRRAESSDRRQKRHQAQLEEELKEMEEKRKEKDNGVEQFIISGESSNRLSMYCDQHRQFLL